MSFVASITTRPSSPQHARRAVLGPRRPAPPAARRRRGRSHPRSRRSAAGPASARHRPPRDPRAATPRRPSLRCCRCRSPRCWSWIARYVRALSRAAERPAASTAPIADDGRRNITIVVRVSAWIPNAASWGHLPADGPRACAAPAAARGRGREARVSVQGVELPPVGSSAGAASLDEARYRRLAKQARTLSWISLAWMTLEGGVALAAGVVASSIALVGFGLDSAIEGFASVIIVWRFTGQRMFSGRAEQRAQKLVAVQFFLLAPYVAIESTRALIAAEHPDESWAGT